MADLISSNIYLDRDSIRYNIIEFLKNYMELSNVDLTKTSFLSFVVDIMSVLTSNLLFYQNSVYKEFFMTKAQLPESIYNLSSFLGYTPSTPTYASTNLLLTFPLPFNDTNINFTIPDGTISNFKFKTSDGIEFLTHYETIINVINNSSVTVSVNQNGKLYNLPVYIDTTSIEQYFQFVLPVRQYTSQRKEYIIDPDLQPYQFTTIDVLIEGKLSNMTLYVREPGSDTNTLGRLYNGNFNSLYLMSSDDYGYVAKDIAGGKKIYFGNGIIGKQPTPGSTVVVLIDVTEGENGNVISGSVTSGSRIYTMSGGASTIVNYNVTNPSPASGGTNPESLQEIRQNSINNLTSLHRLVTENDYTNIKSIITDAPLAQNSIAILKRSDLKCNEIQLFSILNFNNEIVPTRNIYYNVPLGTTTIQRDTIIPFDGIDYITIFDISISTLNTYAEYQYNLRELNTNPVLIQSWSDPNQDAYNLHSNGLLISYDDTSSTVTFNFSYISDEIDRTDCNCSLNILSTDDSREMTNNVTVNGGIFSYTFSNYDDIPFGKQTYYLTISNPNLPIEQLISRYSSTFILKENLSPEYMLSNTSIDTSSSIITIYDIPVVRKSYYDSIDKIDFESIVIQNFISSLDLKNYRMITDFTNVKFCSTTGKLNNMMLNKYTKPSVIDIGTSIIPTSPSLGDRYIVSGVEGGEWNNNRDNIAICSNSTSVNWVFIEPRDNDIVYVTNKGCNYIYTQYGWVKPIYDIPLQITVEVFRTADSGLSDSTIVNNVRSELFERFKDRFGPNITIYRSEIIETVQNVTGVSHCRVINPKSSIFFNFKVSDFNQQQLLEYSPEWIFFKEEDISVRILYVE